MGTWTVLRYFRSTDDCPFEKWKQSTALTAKDRARIDSKVSTIEQLEKLPPETFKKYKTTDLYELKVRGDKKQLRPLCAPPNGKVILILCGSIEKGSKLPHGDLDKAENLVKLHKNGVGFVRRYYED